MTMKHFSLISLFMFPLIMGGCSAQRPSPFRNVVEKRDSVVERMRISSRTEMVPVQVCFDVPDIRVERSGVRDSIDVIETDYVVSTVVMNSDGSYSHGAATKPQHIIDTVVVPVTITDTCHLCTTVHRDSETSVQTVEVNVLRWYQKVLMWCGAALSAFVLIRTMIFLIKHFLKTKL